MIYAPNSFTVKGVLNPLGTVVSMGTVSIAESHFYCNGTTGNDANDGLTIGTPKLTLGAVFALVPDVVKFNTCVHLAGTFTDFGHIPFQRIIAPGILFIIDGGADTTDIVGDTISDINAADHIGLSTIGWTIDTYCGYQIKITSGAASGDIRTIHSNNPAEAYVCKYFSVDPGASAHFKIVRPTTTLTASTTDSSLNVACVGKGIFIIQRLYFSGDQCQLIVQDSAGAIQCSSCVIDATTPQAIVISGSNNVTLGTTVYNVATFTQDTSNYAGTGLRGAGLPIAATPYLYATDCNQLFLCSSYFMCLSLKRIGYTWMKLGIRFHGIDFDNCNCADIESNVGGYAPILCDYADSGNGIRIRNKSYVITGNNVISSNHLYNGVSTALGGSAYISGTLIKLAGADNGAYGVYCGTQSTVLVADGAQPTITGLWGNVTTPAGVSETWANIETGSILLDSNAMSLVREANY